MYSRVKHSKCSVYGKKPGPGFFACGLQTQFLRVIGPRDLERNGRRLHIINLKRSLNKLPGQPKRIQYDVKPTNNMPYQIGHLNHYAKEGRLRLIASHQENFLHALQHKIQHRQSCYFQRIRAKARLQSCNESRDTSPTDQNATAAKQTMSA